MLAKWSVSSVVSKRFCFAKIERLLNYSASLRKRKQLDNPGRNFLGRFVRDVDALPVMQVHQPTHVDQLALNIASLSVGRYRAVGNAFQSRLANRGQMGRIHR